MNLLGQKVRDSITGATGTVVALAQYLNDNDTACVAYGSEFRTEWISVSRLAIEAHGTATGKSDATPITGAATKTDTSPAAAAKAANGAATNGAAPAADPAKAPAPATVYAEVAKAFMVLGKAGQGATIQAILKTHGATHAKEISDNAPALADVLAQAKAAIAALAA
jgi:hypothetical protein